MAKRKRPPWTVCMDVNGPGRTVLFRTDKFITAYDWMREHFSMWNELNQGVAILFQNSSKWLDRAGIPGHAPLKGCKK